MASHRMALSKKGRRRKARQLGRSRQGGQKKSKRGRHNASPGANSSIATRHNLQEGERRWKDDAEPRRKPPGIRVYKKKGIEVEKADFHNATDKKSKGGGKDLNGGARFQHLGQ